MASLYLLHFNNYYNKLVRYYDTLAEYLPYQIGDTLLNTNFNPADGVNAKQIVNWNDDTPDYVIVVDGDVMSRWFVVEAQRTRGRQLELTLKRDVIADYRDAVLNAEAFCEKGWVNNSSPFIFNKENMGFNQIKKSETLMYNNLHTPWVVLYLSRYHKNEAGSYVYNEYKGTVQVEAGAIEPDYTLDDLTDYIYNKYSETPYEYIPTNSISFGGKGVRMIQGRKMLGYTQLGSNYISGISTSQPTSENYPVLPTPFNPPQDNVSTKYQNLSNLYENAFVTDTPDVQINTYTNKGNEESSMVLFGENGKIIATSNGDKYRIVVDVESLPQQYYDIASSSALGIQVVQNCYTDLGISTSGKTLSPVVISNQPRKIIITYQFINETAYDYDITYDGAYTNDAVYEIIATPYNNITFNNGGTVFNHNGDIALQWFQDIVNRYNGAGWAYDIQLVPYCSIDTTNITNVGGKIFLGGGELNRPCVAFKLPKATFSQLYNITLPNFNSNYKISSETDLYRIVSPNGVGEYEFSPAKNGGFTQFEVDCTLIPFNPYIKINPMFNYLYGQDFNDFRGLICQGDFSLPILNDQWSTYQLNNKNYQAIFDRNIESQEYQNKWQLASNIAGIFTGGAGGAAAGGLVGGAPGAVAGGALAGVGGIVDTVASQEMFKESIDRQKDLFGMELGNIKARAQSLSRGTSYNVNNKYFPYLEYYTCTEEELVALNNKLKYNGMTIGVIGTVQQFLNPDETSYYQGTLIEIDITDDAHMADEIARTLQGGIRFAVN